MRALLGWPQLCSNHSWLPSLNGTQKPRGGRGMEEAKALRKQKPWHIRGG